MALKIPVFPPQSLTPNIPEQSGILTWEMLPGSRLTNTEDWQPGPGLATQQCQRHFPYAGMPGPEHGATPSG